MEMVRETGQVTSRFGGIIGYYFLRLSGSSRYRIVDAEAQALKSY